MTPFFPLALFLTALPLAAAGDEVAMPHFTPGAEMGAPGHRPPHHLRPAGREQVSMRMMVRKLLLDRYDANLDLELDADERRQLMEHACDARKQQAVAFIRQFDADGDGQLSAEERAEMKLRLSERNREKAEGEELPPPHQHRMHGRKSDRRHHAPRPPRPHMDKNGRMMAFMVQQLTMEAYDADRNGVLDTEESTRLREDGARLYNAREAELLSLYDADKSGSLSETELQTALHACFPRPQGHHPHPMRGATPPPPPPHQAEDMPPPPPPGRRAAFSHLLDTHFDIDILLNLAHPQGEGTPTTPQ